MVAKLEDKMAGFRPLGYDLPVQEKKYQKHDKKVAQMFEDWLDKVVPLFSGRTMELFEITNWALQRNTICVDELHALLYLYQEHEKFGFAGIFASVVYNLCDEKIIVFDVPLEKEINCLALYLNADKTFVNYSSKLLFGIGYQSQGMLINYGTAGSFGEESRRILNYGTVRKQEFSYEYLARACSEIAINLGVVDAMFGNQMSGVCINYGTTNDLFGYALCEDGILVNCGSTRSFGSDAKGRVIYVNQPRVESHFSKPRLFLLPDACSEIPGLKKYFNDLKQKLEAGRTDYQRACAVLRSLSKQKIATDLEQMITAGGYKW